MISLIQPLAGGSFLSLIFSRFINIGDAQKITHIIRSTPKNKPIDLILNTPGGLVLASRLITDALLSHHGKITVFIPQYAFSGGTYIALAADEINLGFNAVLGRIDPQVYGLPAISIASLTKKKNVNEIEDRTLVLADISKKAVGQVTNSAKNILSKKGYGQEKIKNIVGELISDKYTHDNPISYDEAKGMGLKVGRDIPEEVYALLETYSITQRDGDSVTYNPGADEE